MSDNGMKTETLNLKLEAGKKYVDRRGRVFGPLVICGVARYFGEDNACPLWSESGITQFYNNENCSMDLVAEHIEPEPAEPEPAEECPIDQSLCILDACCGSCDRYTAEQNTVDPGTVNFITKMVDEIFDRIEEPFGKNVAEQPANQTEPQRGQFWSYNSNRKCCVFMIGKNLNGHWVAVNRHGEYEVFSGRGIMSFEYWHHEPGFTNFDGPVEPVEPEKPEPPSSPAEPPTNQQLFEMIANLRDQMNGMNERLRIVERVAAV